MDRLALTISSELSNVIKVENFIDETIKEFELSGDILGRIRLAVIETVYNSIFHGNKQNPQKLVKLTAVGEEQRVIFTVEDEGEGFDFENIPDPTTLENIIKVTGRGLFLMHKLSDELVFEEKGSKVIMSFFINSL